jgi:VWFA-related protein
MVIPGPRLASLLSTLAVKVASLATALLVLTAVASPAAAPPTPQAPGQVPVFTSEVQLITVDAVVLNKQRRPVAGLTKDDFVVTEDGRPVEIVSFEAFVQDLSAEESEEQDAPPAIATNTPSERASGRAFAVLIDDLGIAPERSVDARQAVQSFLESGLRPGDEVVVGTTSGDAWWSGRIPTGREDLLAVVARSRGKYDERFSFNQMTEYEAYRIANFEDSPSAALGSPGAVSGGASGRAAAGPEALPSGAGGVRERVRKRWENAMLCMGTACDAMLRGRATQLNAARRSRTHATLDGVRRGLEALRPIHGRKSLMLVSQGFLSDPQDGRQRAVVALSREANTAVYFLDVRGLTAMPGSGTGSAADPGPGPGVVMETVLAERGAVAFEQSVLESTGSEGLASDTGGFSVRNTNDLGAGAARVAGESRVFYLLGFNAPEGKPPQAWRKLQVATTRPGLEVRARKGYTLSAAAPAVKPPKKGASRGPDPAVVRAVDSPHDASGVPMRARVYLLEPGAKRQTRVLVMAEFDAASLLGSGNETARRLEMSAVARMRDEPLEYRYDQAVELKREAAGTSWRSVVREFGLPPGIAVARVVLRDPASGSLGSVSARFEIPSPDLLRLSTPILSDRVEPARTAGEKPRPALAVSRSFSKDAGLYCQFEVIGAKQGPDGKPRVSTGLTVWSGDGRLVRESPASPVAPSADGRALRLLGIDLAGLPEGSYDLVLDVQDEVGGGRLRQREPFTIASSPAAQ